MDKADVFNIICGQYEHISEELLNELIGIHLEKKRDEVSSFLCDKEDILFSFETSLGEVVCRAYRGKRGGILGRKRINVDVIDFEYLRGKEHIDRLYKGEIESLKPGWIQICLDDGYYGCPEYKIKML